jgi:hypothetical protein
MKVVEIDGKEYLSFKCLVNRHNYFASFSLFERNDFFLIKMILKIYILWKMNLMINVLMEISNINYQELLNNMRQYSKIVDFEYKLNMGDLRLILWSYKML